MDPVSFVVSAFVAGAAAGLSNVVQTAIADAYQGLKTLVRKRFPDVNTDILDKDPKSENRQEVLKDDLVRSNAGADREVVAAAHTLLDVVHRLQPSIGGEIGIDLQHAVNQGSVILQRTKVEGGIHTYNINLGAPPVRSEPDLARMREEEQAISRDLLAMPSRPTVRQLRNRALVLKEQFPGQAGPLDLLERIDDALDSFPVARPAPAGRGPVPPKLAMRKGKWLPLLASIAALAVLAYVVVRYVF